jgi:hypothetical protein
MARPTVKKQIELPGAGNAAGARARLRLVASTASDAYGYASLVDVAGARTVTADATGLCTWTNVRPNSGASTDAITSPTGTVYEVLVTFPDNRRTIEYITVPDTAGIVWVQAILTTAPGALPGPGSVSTAQLSAAIAAHNADTTDVHGIADTALLGAGGARYVHTQSTPATTWPVAHNLGYRPVVSVTDTSYREMEAGVTHTDSNNLTVSLLTALAGYAACV